MGGVLSGYLQSPVTDLEVEDGISKLGLRYGSSTMQGWRVANEDAVTCQPELTDDSALFAVYDGHGGSEIALYVAKYLPMLLKTQYHFVDGKVDHALREAFLAVDKQIVLEETADELQVLSGTKADDEDEEDLEEKVKECEELNEEASMPLVDLLAKYKKKFAECMEEEAAEQEAFEGSGKEAFEGSGKGKKAKKVNDMFVEDGEPAAAVENGDAAPVNGTSEDADHKNGTLNGDAAEDVPELEDEEEEDEDEDDEEDDSEEDSEEGSEGEEGSEDEEDFEEDMTEFDEREGYGSGTTACVAVVKSGIITVANVGDSRCVVCTKGVAKDLSIDHKPENETEKTRIEAAGGKITDEGRINGGLNLSRALGDHQYKQNPDKSPEDQMISPLPDLQTYTISDGDEFMLLACDGIWNVMSSEEAVSFVRKEIEKAKAGDMCDKAWLSDIASKLMLSCLAPDTDGDGTGCDNMTCIIVLLNQDITEESSETKRKLEESEETQESKKSKTS